MKLKKIKSLLLTFTLVSIFSMPAMANEISHDNTSNNKIQYLEELYGYNPLEEMPVEKEVQPYHYGEHNLYSKEYEQYNGGTAYSEISAVAFRDLIISNLTIDSSARTAWMGTNPYNAKSISLSNILYTTGIGLSVTASGSGVSVTPGLTSTTVSKEASISNNWQLNNDLNNVRISGANIYLKATADAYYSFGVDNFGIAAWDSVWP